jgi:hypothetical protein
VVTFDERPPLVLLGDAAYNLEKNAAAPPSGDRLES